jgi:hypothetical protein
MEFISPIALQYTEIDEKEANELLHAIQIVMDENKDIEIKVGTITFETFNYTSDGVRHVYKIEIHKEFGSLKWDSLELIALINPEDSNELIIDVHQRGSSISCIVRGVKLIDIYTKHRNRAIELTRNKYRNNLAKEIKRMKELEVKILKIIKQEPLNSIFFIKEYYLKQGERDKIPLYKIIKNLLEKKEIIASQKEIYELDTFYTITYLGEFRIA